MDRRAYSLAALAPLPTSTEQDHIRPARSPLTSSDDIRLSGQNGPNTPDFTPVPFSISNIPTSEHDLVRRLYSHLTASASSRSRHSSREEWHSRIWNCFEALSPFTRAQLPVPILRDVLHQVVPEKSVVRSWLAETLREEKAKALMAKGEEGIAYPWEGRLQTVISVMLASSTRFLETETTSKLQSGWDQDAAPNPPRKNLVTSTDYLFVLSHLALTGSLSSSESVITELKHRQIPLTRRINLARLKTLSKWITNRSTILRKRAGLQAEKILERNGYTRHSYGGSIKSAHIELSNLIVPEEVATLLKSLLKDLVIDQPLHPRRMALDHLLRIAKEAGDSGALRKILLAGYGLDLEYPQRPVSEGGSEREGEEDMTVGRPMVEGQGAVSEMIEELDLLNGERSRKERKSNRLFRGEDKGSSTMIEGDKQNSLVPLSRHALNTIMEDLGGRGEIWKMLSVFEVLADGETGEDTSGSVMRGMDLSEYDQDRDLEKVKLQLPPTFFSPAERPQAESDAAKAEQEENEEDEGEPLTLTEALEKEERTRQGLSIFGLPKIVNSSRKKDSKASPVKQVSQTSKARAFGDYKRFSDFLSSPPYPSIIESEVNQQIQSGQVMSFQRKDYGKANSRTYAVGIRYAAIYAASRNRTTSQGSLQGPGLDHAAIELGLYFLKRGIRQQIEERCRFLQEWVWIREVTKAASTGMEKNSPAYTDLLAWRDEARKTLTRPSVTINAEDIQPLFSAIHMSASRGRSNGWVKQILRMGRLSAEQLGEELRILIGDKLSEGDAKLVGTPEVSPPSATKLPSATANPVTLDHSSSSQWKELYKSTLINHVPDQEQHFILADHLKSLRADLKGLQEKMEAEDPRLSKVQEKRMNRMVAREKRRRMERGEHSEAAEVDAGESVEKV